MWSPHVLVILRVVIAIANRQLRLLIQRVTDVNGSSGLIIAHYVIKTSCDSIAERVTACLRQVRNLFTHACLVVNTKELLSNNQCILRGLYLLLITTVFKELLRRLISLSDSLLGKEIINTLFAMHRELPISLTENIFITFYKYLDFLISECFANIPQVIWRYVSIYHFIEIFIVCRYYLLVLNWWFH